MPARTPEKVVELPRGAPTCCESIQSAIKDGALQYTRGHGTAIPTKDGFVPIQHCPWCGGQLAFGLYTHPAMRYRP